MAAEAKQELLIGVLREQGSCRLRVSGTSMLPTLWPGETVLVEARPLAEIEVGDIALYQRDRRLILHRVVSASPGSVLVTLGDSMPQVDPWVPTDCVLGVLTGVRRGDQWVRVSRVRSMPSRWAGVVMGHSSWLVRLVLRTRSGFGSALNTKVAAS